MSRLKYSFIKLNTMFFKSFKAGNRYSFINNIVDTKIQCTLSRSKLETNTKRILHEFLCFIVNLLNELRKSDKMRGSPSILSLFRNKFNKFNDTGKRMLDSIYHRTLTFLRNRIFDAKTSILCHLLRNVIMDVITQRY